MGSDGGNEIEAEITVASVFSSMETEHIEQLMMYKYGLTREVAGGVAATYHQISLDREERFGLDYSPAEYGLLPCAMATLRKWSHQERL